MEIFLIILLIISLYKWFIYNMTVKGLLFYIGTEFGEDKMPDEELKEVISKAIELTVKDFFNKD